MCPCIYTPYIGKFISFKTRSLLEKPTNSMKVKSIGGKKKKQPFINYKHPIQTDPI